MLSSLPVVVLASLKCAAFRFVCTTLSRIRLLSCRREGELLLRPLLAT